MKVQITKLDKDFIAVPNLMEPGPAKLEYVKSLILKRIGEQIDNAHDKATFGQVIEVWFNVEVAHVANVSEEPQGEF